MHLPALTTLSVAHHYSRAPQMAVSHHALSALDTACGLKIINLHQGYHGSATQNGPQGLISTFVSNFCRPCFRLFQWSGAVTDSIAPLVTTAPKLASLELYNIDYCLHLGQLADQGMLLPNCRSLKLHGEDPSPVNTLLELSSLSRFFPALDHIDLGIDACIEVVIDSSCSALLGAAQEANLAGPCCCCVTHSRTLHAALDAGSTQYSW